eukprot:13000-Chlamydomonas_euryale.AAC.1
MSEALFDLDRVAEGRSDQGLPLQACSSLDRGPRAEGPGLRAASSSPPLPGERGGMQKVRMWVRSPSPSGSCHSQQTHASIQTPVFPPLLPCRTHA